MNSATKDTVSLSNRITEIPNHGFDRLTMSACRLTMSACFILFFSFSCGSTEDIFPPLPTSTDTATLELPNPVSVAADPANGQS